MAFTLTATPTLVNLRAKFVKANQARIDQQRRESDRLGKLHADEIRRLAPKKTGEFARGITHKVKQSGNDVSFTVSLPQPLGRWLRPPGTKPHIIRPVRAKVLRFVVRGILVFTMKSNHPGYRPKSDFVKDAVDNLKSERRLGLRRISTRYISEITK